VLALAAVRTGLDLCSELCASFDVHLGVDAGQVLLDRVDGDEQALTDRGVGVCPASMILDPCRLK
jgi:hypothetical protein